MNFSDNDLSVAAKELTFAYHTAKHGISLRTAECNSRLVSEFFDPNFNSGRTKKSSITHNIISPLIEKSMKETLGELTFVTLMTDTSNRKYKNFFL